MSTSCEDGVLPVFTIENDKELGQQVAAEIAADPETYPLLDESSYDYAYLKGMMDEILDSETIRYKDEFDWKINVIDDDVLNAFATPGGQIYVYTGLIFFLDKEDDLAGVIGHEIAHADQRHSTKQLQRQYGISFLLGVLTGGQSESIQQIIGSIVGVGALEFSRDAEAEADDYSVEYLSDTDYACNGAAAFFEKLEANETTRNPEFLSTHPDPGNRVNDINSKAAEIGCSTAIDDGSISRYQAFRNSL